MIRSVPDGFIRSCSHCCHSNSSSSNSMGVGGSSTSGGMKEAAGWKDQCLNKHSPTKNKAIELVETVCLKVVMVITCSESFHSSYKSVPSIAEMEVSVSGCLERVLVAIKSSSCDKETMTLYCHCYSGIHCMQGNITSLRHILHECRVTIMPQQGKCFPVCNRYYMISGLTSVKALI